MNNNPNSQINSLRLGQRDLNKLLEKYDQDQVSVTHPNREFVRWSFRVGAVNFSIEQNSGGKVVIPVATRNISRGGMCILHSSFVHLGSICEISLNVTGGKTEVIPGKVVRCSHLQGRIHEVGIAFDEQISTKDLLGLDPLNEAYSLESVEPDRLHGSALIVTPNDLDRDLILVFLEDTNLILNIANSIESAVTKVEKGCDIIIADFFLNDGTGPELVHAIQAAGCDTPVIVMTSDKTEQTLDLIRDAEAAGILSKPLTKHRVLQALAEFLHADGDGGPLYSELNDEDPAFPLVGKFLANVPRMALDLEQALRDNDVDECRKVCRALSGTAAPLGFPTISSLALIAEQKITNKDVKSAASDIRGTIVACRRIKAKPAA